RNALLFFDPWKVPRSPLGRFSIEVHDGDTLTFRRVSSARTPINSAWAECSDALFRLFILLFGFIGLWMRRQYWFQKDAVLIFLWLSFWGIYSMFWPSTRLYS